MHVRLFRIAYLVVIASSAAAIVGSYPASANTVTGIAVGSNSSTAPVGILAAPGTGPDGGNQLGAPAIQYYIPLESSGSVTYGVNGGTSPDSGRGGQTLHMWLLFQNISPSPTNALLTVRFQDLDLSGANDPSNFLESLRLFDRNGNPLTPLITSISQLIANGSLTGNNNWQTLTLALTAISNPFYLDMTFKSCLNPPYCTGFGTNTAEYLLATVTTVPLPGALVLFGSALVGLGVLSRRRRTAASLPL